VSNILAKGVLRHTIRNAGCWGDGVDQFNGWIEEIEAVFPE
jgi:hypothetical protein